MLKALSMVSGREGALDKWWLKRSQRDPKVLADDRGHYLLLSHWKAAFIISFERQ